jgi:predicted Zn-dependent protease
MRANAILIAATAVLLACSTSPLGRKRLSFVPDSQMDQMGVQAFEQLKQQTPLDADPETNARVKRVADRITKAAESQTPVRNWEVRVFNDPSPNAFALPGGKIGVNSGIFSLAKTDDQLATVLGHEVGHVIAKHGAERMSEQVAAQGGLAIVAAFLGGGGDSTRKAIILGALGLGTQVGILLPFSRTQESEADAIGLDLMARAGFDPMQSLEFWKNMIAASKGSSKPPAFLSDHPPDEERVAALEKRMPEALALYSKATGTVG